MEHSGSLVRNGGARLSWRMVPSERISSQSSTPEKTNEASVTINGVARAEALNGDSTEDREIVLKEVEVEELNAVRGVFSSIIAISSTAEHQNQSSHVKNE